MKSKMFEYSLSLQVYEYMPTHHVSLIILTKHVTIIKIQCLVAFKVQLHMGLIWNIYGGEGECGGSGYGFNLDHHLVMDIK